MAKIGEGALPAAARQGLKELAQALPAFPDSNLRPVEEPGQIGTATSREVYEQQHPDPYDQQLAERAAAARPEPEPERDLDRD